MSTAPDGTFSSRPTTTPPITKVSQPHVAALDKQLDRAIKRYAAQEERDREAERAALAARLLAPRPARKRQSSTGAFVPRSD